MNSLADAEAREALFQHAVKPSSIFHNRQELLWNVREFLDRSLTDPNARGDMYRYLHHQIEIRQTGYKDGEQTHPGFLYPTPDSPESDRIKSFRAAWNELADTIKVAAERLWRDQFLNDSSDDTINERFNGRRGDKSQQAKAKNVVASFQQTCQSSHVLMHLYLQTVFFRIRAMQNVRSGELVRHPSNRSQRIEGQLEEVIRDDYLEKLASWDRELRKIKGLDFFGLQYGDVQWFRALSKEFGPSSVHVEETGWITLAADARTELRYQFFKARMRENWKTHHYLTSAIQWLFGFTTGFGTRPRRFLATAFILISAYFFLFLANDWFQIDPRTKLHFCAASGSASLDWWHLLIKYLYLAVTNMSSLGSDTTIAQFCGTAFSQALLASSAIVGYFLLAMLAALLFQIITERD